MSDAPSGKTLLKRPTIHDPIVHVPARAVCLHCDMFLEISDRHVSDSEVTSGSGNTAMTVPHKTESADAGVPALLDADEKLGIAVDATATLAQERRIQYGYESTSAVATRPCFTRKASG